MVALGLILAQMMEDGPLAIDLRILRSAADLRTAFLVDVAKVFDAIASAPAIFIVRIATVLVLAFVKRWRHFVVLLLTWGVSDLVFLWLHVELPVPPVPVLAEPVSSSGDPAYYFPGVAMMALSITVFGMCYALAPAGSTRRWARWGATALLAGVGLSKILAGGRVSERGGVRHRPRRDRRVRRADLARAGRGVPRLVREGRQRRSPRPERR